MSDDEWYDNDSSEELDDYEELEVAGEPGGSREEEAPVYKIINKTSLLAAQLHDLRRVSDVLGIRLQHARTLLIYHRWDVEALFGKLADQGEERLFLSAGLPPRGDVKLTLPQELPPVLQCRICYADVAASKATMMDCSHSFCNDCWTQYFIIKIKDGQSRRVTCMEEKCNAICDEHKVRSLVSAVDKSAAGRYDLSLLESYIEDNSKVKWCPSVPHCGNAISVEGEPFCELECVCSQQFCFNCLEEPHSPCSCQMWRLWDKKCKDESETVNWLTAHTKPCPKCQKPVEKNGGCNLVGCICGQAFCWLCGAATGREHTWTNIQGHSCGRYKDDVEKEAERAQRDLKRYIHYHSRWKAHMDSLQLEQKKKEEAQARIAKLEASESQVKDYTWLTNGLQRLFRARRALAYSYAFAYYMFGNDLFKGDIEQSKNEMNQFLFEDQQQQLESAVEKLSKLVETNMELSTDDGNVQKIRMEVINLTALADSLCKRMYDVIENDLLGSLELTSHHIAPYKSQGYSRVAEVADSEVDNRLLQLSDAVNSDQQTEPMDIGGASFQQVPRYNDAGLERTQVPFLNDDQPPATGFRNHSEKPRNIDDMTPSKSVFGERLSHERGLKRPAPDSNVSGSLNLRRGLGTGEYVSIRERFATEGSEGHEAEMLSENCRGNQSNGNSHKVVGMEGGSGGACVRSASQDVLLDLEMDLSVNGVTQTQTDGGEGKLLEPAEACGIGGSVTGHEVPSNAVCPVCQMTFDRKADNVHINAHVDQCLANVQ